MSGKSTLQDLIEKAALSPAEVQAARSDLEQERTSYQLRALRKRAGLTQGDLAQLLGVSQNRISRLERGHASRVLVGTLRRYVEALGGQLHVSMTIGGVDFPIDSAEGDEDSADSAHTVEVSTGAG